MLRHRFSWKRLSMSAAVGFAPDGSDAWLVFNMRPGAYNAVTLIEFLEDLHHPLGADKVTVIWDGLASHRSKAMKSWIAAQRHWLVVEQPPGYGHDYTSGDPSRCANLTGANLTCANLTDVDLNWGTNLTAADLHVADPTGAGMSDANLFGADLETVDLTGAIGLGSVHYEITECPNATISTSGVAA